MQTIDWENLGNRDLEIAPTIGTLGNRDLEIAPTIGTLGNRDLEIAPTIGTLGNRDLEIAPTVKLFLRLRPDLRVTKMCRRGYGVAYYRELI